MSNELRRLQYELMRMESLIKHYSDVEWKLRVTGYLKSGTIELALEAARARRSTILKRLLVLQLEEFDRG